jgi:hypothetical protein
MPKNYEEKPHAHPPPTDCTRLVSGCVEAGVGPYLEGVRSDYSSSRPCGVDSCPRAEEVFSLAEEVPGSRENVGDLYWKSTIAVLFVFEAGLPKLTLVNSDVE